MLEISFLVLRIESYSCQVRPLVVPWVIDVCAWVLSPFSSVQWLSRVRLFATPWTTACQASLSITTPGVYSNSCPLSRWCHPTVSSSVVPFSSRLQSFPASGSSQWGGSSHQMVKVSEFQLQHQSFQWIFRTDFPLGWTGWISLQSRGLSRVFSNTTVQKKKSFQLCPILCDPMGFSPPGSSVYGILQARILERGAISFARGSSWPRVQTHTSYVSCIGKQVLHHWRHLGYWWSHEKAADKTDSCWKRHR